MSAAGSLLVALIVSRKWWAGGFEWKFVRESLPIALPVLPHFFLALGLVVADRFILEYYQEPGRSRRVLRRIHIRHGDVSRDRLHFSSVVAAL